MPAYFDTGFSVRQPMWHGEGNVLADYPESWAEARTLAGLEWEPEAHPIFGRRADADLDFLTADDYVEEKDHKRIVRNDTGVTLGVVGDGYELIQHSAMGEILEAITDQPNVKFETAGSCRGGAQVWALAYLDEPYEVAGDDSATLPFIALLNSHDGTGACKVVATQVRVVCWNTYRAAEMEGARSGRSFTFRHTSGVHERIEDAKQALAGVRSDAAEWTKLAAELGGLAADDVALNHFMADFIPEPPAALISPRVRTNIDTARATFRSMYLDSPTTDGHRGTALGLVDTAVEYLDHVRGFRSQDTLMGRTLLRPEPLKAKAVLLARQVCHA